MSPSATTTPKLRTRAVLRTIEAGGDWPFCAHCGDRVVFRAARKLRQVICNVYGGRPRRWRRVEHFHEICYQAAGAPHGPVDSSKVQRNG